MEKVKDLQLQGIVKMAFDRAGTSTARAEDVPLFEAGDAMKIKETVWFYGYTTAVKRCISLELQNFRGTLELICVDGGPVTQVEAQEIDSTASCRVRQTNQSCSTACFLINPMK